MRLTFPLLVILLGAALPSLAALGDTLASVESDQKHFQARLKSTSAQNYTIHELSRDDGLVINEYVSRDGKVFGVSWNGPVLPDLSQLLGSYVKEFRDQARVQPGRRRAVVVRSGDLTVESGKRLRDFRGRAYVNSLLPSGVSQAAVQ
jgi:Protein of unknown function (DUF2844)